MDSQEESSKATSLPNVTGKNLSSPSSAFYTADQSPGLIPKSPSSLSTLPEMPCDAVSSVSASCTSSDFQKIDEMPSSTAISNSDEITEEHGNDHCRPREKQKRNVRSQLPAVIPTSLESDRLRSCDLYIGFHGLQPLLLRFTNWLRAELEMQGLRCYVKDRARCRNSREHDTAERALLACTFGVVILTKKSFSNRYTIEELHFFSNKKNLVPIYFDVSPDDCQITNIVEQRGELWERHGGEVWLLYGGLENEWKEAVNALTGTDEWKLEAHDGRWRDCILRAVVLLGLRLGRRNILDRVYKWRHKAEKEEFPFPRNNNFIGRKRELFELEFILFGDVFGDSENDFFELKPRATKKNLTIGWPRNSSADVKRKEEQPESSKRKGKEPVIWSESETEIEIKGFQDPEPHHLESKFRNSGKEGRSRSMKVVYGKGIGCVSGDSGIGKTELILEYAYRFRQRYKMVLWIGGERRYIRQNYLNMGSFLEVDVGVESTMDERATRSFEELEEVVIARVRKEFMREIPYLVVIDNLESERDWWDDNLVMDLLPRFGRETHVLISTRLSHVMNLEPLRLSYLTKAEGMTLMQGRDRDYSVEEEIDALHVIEERLGRLTLGLAIVGAILSELPISPRRLLDTIDQVPSRESTWTGRECNSLRQNNFLLQLFEVCFSIFDHAESAMSLATTMVLASGWFAPSPIPVSLLALAANKLPEKQNHGPLSKKIFHSLSCGLTSLRSRRLEAEASSLLATFNIARDCTKEGYIQFNQLTKLYARKRGESGAAQAMVQAVIGRGSLIQHSDHMWAACFLILGFGNDPVVNELKVSELLYLAKDIGLPLGVRTFFKFSRCRAAIELLRLCTNALEAKEEAFIPPVDTWLDKSLCWKSIPTNGQLNPFHWKELALARAAILETRARFMLRGGHLDIADELIRKAIFVRTSISGENHPDMVSARALLSKITELLDNVETNNSP